MTKNLHLFLTNFTHESRALKQSKSLIDSGLFNQVIFAVTWDETLKEHELIDDKRKIWRVRLSIPKKRIVYRLRYFEWILRIIFSKELEDVSVIQVHSLLSLPAGVLIKFLRGTKLIYDAHELETESNGLKGNRKILYKFLEKFFIPHANAVIVVSESISEWYASNYKIQNLYVVKNVPSICEKTELNLINDNQKINLKEELNLSQNDTLYIYVGGLFKGRGIEIILDTFAELDASKHIVFMGYGELEKDIKIYQKEFSNIHFHPAVNPNQVISYTQTADIGIALIENICLSYYFCLPNKVFEYLLSEIPMIVSDFPEMSKLVDDYECGWKVGVNKSSLLQLVNAITQNSLKQRKENISIAKKSFGWHIEEKVFLDIYRNIGAK
jgi:glycosyltransferase involved in cell wall biosynthesis